MDDLTPEQRRRCMQANRGKGTRPELVLRAALRAARLDGYRLHPEGVPGKPDIAYTRWRVAVFVDGGFWHGRPGRWNPSTASDYWRDKINRNIERDGLVNTTLRSDGWEVLRLWDDEVLKDPTAAAARVREALERRGRSVVQDEGTTLSPES